MNTPYHEALPNFVQNLCVKIIYKRDIKDFDIFYIIVNIYNPFSFFNFYFILKFCCEFPGDFQCCYLPPLSLDFACLIFQLYQNLKKKTAFHVKTFILLSVDFCFERAISCLAISALPGLHMTSKMYNNNYYYLKYQGSGLFWGKI